MHAEQRVVAGLPAIPGGQRARNPVAQHPRIAGEVVDLVTDLQGQRVVRPGDAEVFECSAGRMPAAGGELRERVEMRTFAFVGGQQRGGRDAVPRDRQPGRFGSQQVQPALQHPGHRHFRSDRQRALDAGDRIVDEAARFVRGLFEGCEAVGIGAAGGVAGGIGQGHVFHSCRKLVLRPISVLLGSNFFAARAIARSAHANRRVVARFRLE